jgi:hypothetical protein
LNNNKHLHIPITATVTDTTVSERFEYSLNEALNKKYNYIVGELNYGDSHTTDPMRTWLQRFKDKDYHIVSIILEASREMRLHRCRTDPKRNPFDKIDEMFFNHDSDSFERIQHYDVFQEKSGIREITLIPKINLLLKWQMKFCATLD